MFGTMCVWFSSTLQGRQWKSGNLSLFFWGLFSGRPSTCLHDSEVVASELHPKLRNRLILISVAEIPSSIPARRQALGFDGWGDHEGFSTSGNFTQQELYLLLRCLLDSFRTRLVGCWWIFAQPGAHFVGLKWWSTKEWSYDSWVVVSNIFWNFHPYLGKIPILTHIFFKMGWFNHQLLVDRIS